MPLYLFAISGSDKGLYGKRSSASLNASLASAPNPATVYFRVRQGFVRQTIFCFSQCFFSVCSKSSHCMSVLSHSPTDDNERSSLFKFYYFKVVSLRTSPSAASPQPGERICPHHHRASQSP